MKYKDIKVGDTVYVNMEIRYGFHISKIFYVPRKVIKITKTQFTVEKNRRFKKEDGREINSEKYCSYACKEGENFRGFIIKDETYEMKKFLYKIRLEQSIIQHFSDFKLKIDSSLSLKELEDIFSKIKQIKHILLNQES